MLQQITTWIINVTRSKKHSNIIGGSLSQIKQATRPRKMGPIVISKLVFTLLPN
jgi:hypothetical protein